MNDVLELDNPVLGAPRMSIAGADLETEPLVKIGSPIEIADGDDEVIDAAWHIIPLLRASYHVGPGTPNVKPVGFAPPPRG